jgi:hypothetical protein
MPCYRDWYGDDEQEEGDKDEDEEGDAETASERGNEEASEVRPCKRKCPP